MPLSLTLNGAPQLVDSSTVAELLVELSMLNKRLAVELNKEVLSREQFAETSLHDGDVVEIVQFVGGG